MIWCVNLIGFSSLTQHTKSVRYSHDDSWHIQKLGLILPSPTKCCDHFIYTKSDSFGGQHVTFILCMEYCSINAHKQFNHRIVNCVCFYMHCRQFMFIFYLLQLYSFSLFLNCCSNWAGIVLLKMMIFTFFFSIIRW